METIIAIATITLLSSCLMPTGEDVYTKSSSQEQSSSSNCVEVKTQGSDTTKVFCEQ